MSKQKRPMAGGRYIRDPDTGELIAQKEANSKSEQKPKSKTTPKPKPKI